MDAQAIIHASDFGKIKLYGKTQQTNISLEQSQDAINITA
jgi:hypothetical protein